MSWDALSKFKGINSVLAIIAFVYLSLMSIFMINDKIEKLPYSIISVILTALFVYPFFVVIKAYSDREKKTGHLTELPADVAKKYLDMEGKDI